MTTTAFLTCLFLFPFGAQDPCTDQGSRFVPRRLDRGPRITRSMAAPHPIWCLDTPAHREPISRQGFRPGRIRDIPRRLIRYRQTGLWSSPIATVSIQYLDFVYDITEHRCR